MKMPDKLYDFLKWMTLVALPALGTFLGVLLPGVDVPDDVTKTVITIISALTAFIGTLIGISTVAYKADKNGSN